MAIKKDKSKQSMLGSVDITDFEIPTNSEHPVQFRIKTTTAGRKRLELIPGDIDKTISLQLPSTLIKKIQQYGLEHGQTMKEVIGIALMEKFMK